MKVRFCHPQLHNSKALRGLSQLGRVRLVGLHGGELEGTHLHLHTAFPADSIERSTDLVEPVIQDRLMANPQSADGDVVLP